MPQAAPIAPPQTAPPIVAIVAIVDEITVARRLRGAAANARRPISAPLDRLDAASPRASRNTSRWAGAQFSPRSACPISSGIRLRNAPQATAIAAMPPPAARQRRRSRPTE